MRNRVPPFSLALLAIALITCLRCPAQGQDIDPSGIRARSNTMKMLERDAKRSGVRLPESPADLRQLRKDFERIQILDRDVIAVQAAGGVRDFQELSNAAAEIRKRAERLQALLLPPVKAKGRIDEKEVQTDVGVPHELPAMLTKLDASIRSLVTNPVFRNTRVIDAAHTMQARSDMASVLTLSERIREEADREQKAGKGVHPDK
jgi:hypothetical protein